MVPERLKLVLERMAPPAVMACPLPSSRVVPSNVRLASLSSVVDEAHSTTRSATPVPEPVVVWNEAATTHFTSVASYTISTQDVTSSSVMSVAPGQ